MPNTYTTREVARQLGMAVRSVQMMVDRGELEAWRTPGGHRRIAADSVERWRAERGLPAWAPAAPLAPAEAPTAAPTAASPAASTAPAAAPPPPSLPTALHPLRRATDRIGALQRPALVPAAPMLEAVQSRAAQGASASAVPPARVAALAPSEPRVLLIEDSVHFQNLMALLLRQHFPGLPFYVASDGISGLAMAGQLQPQVLVVDILLPGIDGSALVTGLRSHAQFEGTQLVVITSLDSLQREPYAHALAGIPVIHKPRLAVDLPPLLRQMLGTRTGASASPGAAAR